MGAISDADRALERASEAETISEATRLAIEELARAGIKELKRSTGGRRGQALVRLALADSMAYRRLRRLS